MTQPFAVPRRLSPDLARVQAYWRGLLRGAADMPFWDDVDLSDLGDLQGRLMLIDVFAAPERFRFGAVGRELGADLQGRFLDETAPARPLEFLRAQATATVEAATPTWRRDQARSPGPYARLLLPLWGDGRVSMLLGAVDLG